MNEADQRKFNVWPEILPQFRSMSRRVEIVAFELERTIQYAHPIRDVGRCPVCGTQSQLLTTTQAALVSHVASNSIRRWLAQGKTHSVKTAGGQHRVWRESLFHRHEKPFLRRLTMRTKITLTTMTISLLAALVAVAAITILTKSSPVLAQGATQISGVAFYAEPGECTDPQGQGSAFALRMTGDLEGCHYVFVESHECSPSGTYRETGAEIFVGDYNGQFGSFGTTYLFTAKYEDCSNLIGEIFGRCEHPLIENTGTGVFEGFTGRLDFKDDVEAGSFPYRGHLRH